MDRQTSVLLEEVALRLTESEVHSALVEALDVLDECGIEVEADSVEEFAEMLLSIEESDLELDERAARQKVGLLKRLGSLIRKGAGAVGKAVGAYQKKVADNRKRGQQRIKAVKNTFSSFKRAYTTAKNKATKSPLKPGEKMVFGKARKVRK